MKKIKDDILTKELTNAFYNKQTNLLEEESVIATQLLSLYTKESAEFYSFLNVVLNKSNEGLILIINKLVKMMCIALFKYDDSKITAMIPQ